MNSPVSGVGSTAVRAARLLTTGAMVAALSLIAGFAGIGAYIAMAFAIPVLALVLWKWRWINLQDRTFPGLILLAHAILAAALVLPGRPAGSVVYVFDFMPFALAAAVYVGACRLKQPTLLQIVTHACLFGAAIALAFGIFQVFALGKGRADGLWSAINYANVSLLLGFLALGPLFSRDQWRGYFTLGPLMGISAALLSGSRSVLPVGFVLICVLGVHLLSWLRASPNRALVHRVLIAGICGVLALVAVMVMTDSPQITRIADTFGEVYTLLETGTSTDVNIAVRLDYYSAALKVFLDAPMTGYGWHQAIPAVEPYITVFDTLSISRFLIPHLHNDVLQFAVSLGVFGVIAYFLALFAPVIAWARTAWGRFDAGSFWVFSVSLSFGAMGLTNTNFVYEAPKVMFCFAAAIAAALVARRRQRLALDMTSSGASASN